MICQQCGFSKEKGPCQLCGFSNGETVKLLGNERKAKLNELFDLIDEDKNGHIDNEEAIHFGMCFGLTRKEAQKRVSAMMSLDKNSDGVLDLPEWYAFYSNMLPRELSDAEFNSFFSKMIDVVKRSKQPIKWGPTAKKVFGGFILVTILVRVALLLLTFSQWDDWSTLNSFVDQSDGINSYLRLIACIFGLILGAVGVFVFLSSGNTRSKVLACFGYLSILLAILFLVSSLFDAISMMHGNSKCSDACDENCNVLPVVEQRSCQAMPCVCGYTIGVGPATEIQMVSLTAAKDDIGGSFAVSFAGYSTAFVDVAATAAAVGAAIEDIQLRNETGSFVTFKSHFGSVAVTKGVAQPFGSSWSCNFTGILNATDLMIGNSSKLTGSTVSLDVTEVRAGRAESSVVPVPENPAKFDGIAATVSLDFAAFCFASIAGLIALFYSTNLGKNKYLSDWSESMFKMGGLSAAQKKLLKTFWFSDAPEPTGAV